MSNARILADLMGTNTTVPSSKLSLVSTDMPTGTTLQTVSTNFTDILSISSSDSTGVATGVTNGFSFVPSQSYVNITAKKSNSKYLIQFDGNASASTETSYGDWIVAWGFIVDPAGGTSWTQIGSGTNVSNSNNVKFYASRADASGGGNDGWHSMQLCGNYLYTSTVSAGTTLRFAIEYFHYDASAHETMYINRRTSDSGGGNAAYQGGMATTISVQEIAG
jgi:hypothetical protein